MRRFAYASAGLAVFSAIGSVPMHLSPLTIAILQEERGQSVLAAGITVSVTMAGVFLASLTGLLTIDRAWFQRAFRIALPLFVLGLLSTLATNGAVFLLSWLIVGVCSGLFVQIGMVSAARSDTKYHLFGLRLGSVLVLTALVCAMVALSGRYSGYLVMVLSLAAVAVVLRVFLTINFSSIAPEHPTNGCEGNWISGAVALGVLLIFGTGQVSFLAHASQFLAPVRGGFEHVASAIAAAKLVVGLAMIVLVLTAKSRSLMFVYGGLTTCIVSAAAASVTMPYYAGVLVFLAFDLAFNVSTAAVMALVASEANTRQKTLIMSVALCGAVIGPLLGAVLIEAHGFFATKIAVLTSASITAIWAHLAVRSLRSKQIAE